MLKLNGELKNNMTQVVGFIMGMCLIVLSIILHTFLQTYAEYKESIEREVEKDKEEFGYCCGMETGKCTYQPKIDKINKADPHHKN
jgi:hypothetical protein